MIFKNVDIVIPNSVAMSPSFLPELTLLPHSLSLLDKLLPSLFFLLAMAMRHHFCHY